MNSINAATKNTCINDCDYDHYSDESYETYATEGAPYGSSQDYYVSQYQTPGAPTAAMNYDAELNDMADMGDPQHNEGLQEFQKEIEGLCTLIEENTNLSPAKKAELMDELKKLETKAELHMDMVDQYQEGLDKIREEYEGIAQFSSETIALSERYGQSPEEIESLAQKHGLDLKNLPNPVNESVLKFLSELDPSLGESLQGAKKAVEDKQKKDAEMVQQAKDRNTTAVMSNKDMDNTDLSAYEYLLQAQTGTDQASLDMNEKLAAFQGQVEDALSALYGNGNASLDTEMMNQAFELNVPRLPDEAPELVPMAWDGRGGKSGGNFDKMEWPAWVQDYPKIEYNGNAKE